MRVLIYARLISRVFMIKTRLIKLHAIFCKNELICIRDFEAVHKISQSWSLSNSTYDEASLVISRFFSSSFTITGAKNVVHFTENFVI